MAIRKIPKETKVFHYYNANPADLRTGDCTYRAMALALNKTWEQVVIGLAITAIKTKYSPADRANLDVYLKEHGWRKMPQPKKNNGKKYTVKEFCESIADCEKVYYISVAHHCTCVKECKAWDIWDCTGKTVGDYSEKR